MAVTIASVAVKREGEAAFASLEGDTSGPVVVIDGGGRTVNIALFRDGQYRDGRTLELGVQAALDNLDKALIGRGLRTLTLAERGELESALINGQSYSIIVAGVAHAITPLARAQLDETARALVQEVYRVCLSTWRGAWCSWAGRRMGRCSVRRSRRRSRAAS